MIKISNLSGRCDLYDHISFLSGKYTKDGKLITDEDNNYTCYYSNLLKDFEEFKKRTGGVIYQYFRIFDINDLNREFIKNNNEFFDYEKHEKEVQDKRTKSGKKIITYYTYKYFNREISEREILEHGIVVSKPIHFNIILDLLQFFPYLVISSISSDNKMKVYISNCSSVDSDQNEKLKFGYDGHKLAEIYRKNLVSLCVNVVKNYFLYKLNERTHAINLNFEDLVLDTDGENYYIKTINNADYMHDPYYSISKNKNYTPYSKLKVIDGKIFLHKNDVERLKRENKNNNILITYVEKLSQPNILL